jgi:2-phosphosulfolactate phosphatase
MQRTVRIDCFVESVPECGAEYAIVAVDVVRATTTAITAVAAGRRCFIAPTVESAQDLYRRLGDALLAGEQSGIMPSGFDLNNSPVELLARTDLERPVILLSSSGTRLCHHASKCADVVFLACLRNYSSLAHHLERANFRHVAIVGAASRGEFREEDQMCCAWIAESLIERGYLPKNHKTIELVKRWSKAPVDAWIGGKSAAYLTRSGQDKDVSFILANVGDLTEPFMMHNEEVLMASRIARKGGGCRLPESNSRWLWTPRHQSFCSAAFSIADSGLYEALAA